MAEHSLYRSQSVSNRFKEVVVYAVFRYPTPDFNNEVVKLASVQGSQINRIEDSHSILPILTGADTESSSK